jgi:hypothetical protein
LELLGGTASSPVADPDAGMGVGSFDSNSSFSINFENGNGNNAGVYNEGGELEAYDDAGNTTTLT